MKIKHICKNCNKEYYSDKQNSKFCSMKCKKEYGHVSYNCDYCGKEFLAKRCDYDKLMNGDKKHLYCSRECANNENRNSVTKICKNCGEEFIVWKSLENQQFCSKDCMNEYNINNSVNKNKICPICKNEFKQKHKNQIYCSVKCRNISYQSRATCICDYCGKEFDRKKSEVDKNKRHYCSDECKRMGMFWSHEDTEILVSNYGKIPYKQMIPLFKKERTVDEIKRRAIYLGLTSSREWTKGELNILYNNYSTTPIKQLMKLLPDRTYSSILHQGRIANLKSYFYLTWHYTNQEDEYIKDNYLKMSDKELAEHLGRTEKGISQHLYVLDLHRPKEIGKYKNLIEYVRSKISTWVNNVKENVNYTCALSGSRSNIVLHHIRGFNLLFGETIEILDFPDKEFNDYTTEELDNFVSVFIQLQEFYNSYICITENIHKDFHSIYGYGNNTEEQWNEYIEKYYNK